MQWLVDYASIGFVGWDGGTVDAREAGEDGCDEDEGSRRTHCVWYLENWGLVSRLFVCWKGCWCGVWTIAWLNLSVVDGYLGRVVGPYLSSSGGSIN